MSTSPRLAEAKRDWGHDETGCTILHVDMDAFYASCEIARHPELRGRPVVIGTGHRAVVSAASYEARPYGVNSAMPVATARRLCPQAVFLPVDMAYYRSVSRRIFALMGQVTDRIERTSVDEGYMDVSGALLRWERPTAIGSWIRREVEGRFGVTCSVGVASNKLVAKLASTNAKPNGMLLIPMSRQTQFVRMLPLRAIPGIGPALGRRLEAWGVTTVAQLAELSERQLVQATGSSAQARRLWMASRGLDDREVTPYAPEKSIGSERTFDSDTSNPRVVTDMLLHCSDVVASSLRRRGLMARTVTVKLRFDDLSYSSKSRTLERPVDTAHELYPQAVALLELMMGVRLRQGDAVGDGASAASLPRRIRLAGVSVTGLSEKASTVIQGTFDDVLDDAGEVPAAGGTHGDARTARVERTLDSIRRKYGGDAVGLGLH